VNLYLVGYRCTGKSSVGQIVSDALGWVFLDIDDALQAEEGRAIEQIVLEEGWEYFRTLETNLVQRVSRGSNQVIATGGGVVTNPGNVALMKGSGKVVWLQASPKTIAQRMKADSNTGGQRPPLRGKDSIGEIEEILSERLPLYQQAMHFRIDTDGLSPREVAARILRWLETELPAGSNSN
jgi:shikimate kinase